MFCQLFGKYLVEKNYITPEQLDEVYRNQAFERVKIGTIAIAEKLLTKKQTDEINYQQTQIDKKFGEIALEKNYLTKEQLEFLLSKQGSNAMKFIQLLTSHNYISISDLDGILTDFQSIHGFNREEMNALKEDNLDVLIPLFAVCANPMITKLAGIAIRNITRFVTTNFYFGKLTRVNRFDYSLLVGQKTFGNGNTFLCFASEDNTEGILNLASFFAHEKFTELNDNALDAICEFANLCDGILTSSLSEQNIFIDLEPPFIYMNQFAEGTAYVMPVCIDNREFKLYLSVNESNVFGTKPYTLISQKDVCEVDNPDNKKTVLIVDDSALIRKVLRNLLTQNGYLVVGEAVNGGDAIIEYRRLHPDIVTMDVTMPNVDGVSALKSILREYNDANIVMITASGQKQKIMESLKSGARGFICKPFNEEDVLKTLEDL